MSMFHTAYHTARVAMLTGLVLVAPMACDTQSAARPATRPATQPAGADTAAARVMIDNFTFSPAVLTVAPGTAVTWLNRDDVPHTATSSARPRAFASPTLDTDEQYTHVFTAPGSYPYFCALHPHMTGTIVVK